MAVTQAKKIQYAERIKEYKQKIDQIESSIKEIEKNINANKDVAAYGKVTIANHYLNKISIYCTMSDISLELLGIKNEGFLNDGRKDCYKMLSILEEIVGTDIDTPFSESENRITSLQQLDDIRKYNFLKKLGYTVATVEEKFGVNSKWKWSFVDLAGEVAVVTKNMTDFKSIQSQMDPRIEGFNERMNLMRLIKENLKNAADRYRQKYEMVSHEPSEMKKAILYLSALMRVNILFSEGDESQNTKKTMAIWQEKLDNDLKDIEEKEKKEKTAKK